MSWPRFFADLGYVLWLTVPTIIVANILPVYSGRNGTPIDRDWQPNGDGLTLFGPHKTWQGLIGGVFGAVAISVIAIEVAGLSHLRHLVFAWGRGPWVRGGHMLFLASGALLGDLVKSYFKRRRGIAAGKAWPLMDQLDAIVGAFFLSWVTDVALYTHGDWFYQNLIPGRWPAVLALIPIYLGGHTLISKAGHTLGHKSHPH